VSSLPYIVMTGGLVDLPELRFTPSGKAVASLRLATKKRVKGASGQWEDGDPLYLSVTVWDKVAENVAETLTRKGQRVTVTGRLEQQWWEAKDGGGKQSKFVIVADSVSVDLTFSTYEEHESAAKTAAGPSDDPWAASAPEQTDEPPF
jgi:single-strand DNA-binding protein